jgi:Heterokaryon incompatibility protein (HET)
MSRLTSHYLPSRLAAATYILPLSLSRLLLEVPIYSHVTDFFMPLSRCVCVGLDLDHLIQSLYILEKMSSPVAANDGYEHLDVIAFQFGLACFSIYFQEGILLPQVSAWITRIRIRVFGISTTKRFEKGLQDKPDLGYISLFWLEALSPFICYPSARLFAASASSLTRFLGLSKATWSMVCHLFFLRRHFPMAALDVISMLQRDGPSWERLPFDELLLNTFSVWRLLYGAIWWYQLHIAGNASTIYSWVEYLAGCLISKNSFALFVISEIALRSFRSACGLTFNEALWKGSFLVTPLEHFSLMDSDEREMFWISVMILALEKVTLGFSKVRSVFWDLQHHSAAMDKVYSDIENFSFDKLDDCPSKIRLLRVEYKSCVASPAYTLITVPLAHAPNYEAISYTWDDQKADQAIIINNRQFLVTLNAQRIIENRLFRSRDRWLWIDAVCINQRDNLEKSAQVAIMGSIYRSAALVTVWLDTREVKMSDTLLATSLLYTIRRRRIFKRRYHVRNEAFIGNSRMWRALERLITHNYWSRVWVIQELALAKRKQIVYGGLCISGEIFTMLVADDIVNFRGTVSTCMALSGVDVDQHLLATMQISRIQKCIDLVRGDLAMSLTEVLTTAVQANSKDPRDKIFGFYNIIQHARPPKSILTELKPNYNRCTGDLFMAVASRLLPQDPGFVFNRAGIGYTDRLFELPSWVPDWSEVGHCRGQLKVQQESSFRREFRYEAGGSSPFRYHVDPVGRLHLRGVLIGYISSMVRTLRPNGYRLHDPQYDGPVDVKSRREFFDNLAAYCHEITAIAVKTPKAYPITREDRTQAICRTMVGDRIVAAHETESDGDDDDDDDNLSPKMYPVHRDIAVLYECWVQWGIRAEDFQDQWTKLTSITFQTQWDRMTKMPNDLMDRVRNATKFQRILENTTNNGRFVITNNGLMATVPPHAMLDDLIFVVPGLPKPIVLRSFQRGMNEDHAETWTLVGDCYVHGLMRGEALDKEHKILNLLIL